MQEVALLDDQVSMEDALLVTDAGLAASDTVGDGGKGTLPAQFAGSDPAPPQAAIARASRGTSGDVSVRSEVCIRKIAIPVPLSDATAFRGNPGSDDLRGAANDKAADASLRAKFRKRVEN